MKEASNHEPPLTEDLHHRSLCGTGMLCLIGQKVFGAQGGEIEYMFDRICIGNVFSTLHFLSKSGQNCSEKDMGSTSINKL